VNATSGGSEAVRWSEAVASWDQEAAWSRTLALTTSEDMAGGLFLRGTLKAVRALGDEALVARSSAACGQTNFLEFFNYPASVLLRLLAEAVPSLAQRHGDVAHALWLLGNCVGRDFLDSESGRAMCQLLRREAKRLMNHLPAAYQLSLTGTRAVQWLGPQHCRFVMTHDVLPAAFHEGLLVALLEHMDTRRIHVEGVQTGPLAREFDISWR
jgi:uncharacterized protein (TIGR02265 family)